MTATCPHCSEPIKDFVPKDRLNEEARKRREAEAERAEAQAAMEAAQGAEQDVEALRTERDQALSQLQTEQAKGENFRAIVGAGIDPAVAAGFEREFMDLPEDTRGDLAGWIDGMKADPTKAPPLLAPHLTQQDSGDGQPPVGAGDQQGGTGQPPTGGPAPRPTQSAPAANRGASPHPHAPAQFDIEAIKRMSQAEFEANVQAISDAQGRRRG